MLEYYLLLRSVVRAQPHLQRCLKRCWHCGIVFLTDPRNAGRRDERQGGRKRLGCPFGCREAHERQGSTRRSVAYYQSKEGKKKKQALNQRRRRSGRGQALEPKVEAPPPAVSCRWPAAVVEHVRMVVSLIEGRRVSLEEILEMLANVLRQRSYDRPRKIDHALAWLHEHPP